MRVLTNTTPFGPSASERAFGTSAEYTSIEKPGGSFSASSLGGSVLGSPMRFSTSSTEASGRSGFSRVADARSVGAAAGADAAVSPEGWARSALPGVSRGGWSFSQPPIMTATRNERPR